VGRNWLVLYTKTGWTYLEQVRYLSLTRLKYPGNNLHCETILCISKARLAKFITAKIVFSIFVSIYYFKTSSTFYLLLLAFRSVLSVHDIAYFHFMLYTSFFFLMFCKHNNFCELISKNISVPLNYLYCVLQLQSTIVTVTRDNPPCQIAAPYYFLNLIHKCRWHLILAGSWTFWNTTPEYMQRKFPLSFNCPTVTSETYSCLSFDVRKAVANRFFG